MACSSVQLPTCVQDNLDEVLNAVHAVPNKKVCVTDVVSVLEGVRTHVCRAAPAAVKVSIVQGPRTTDRYEVLVQADATGESFAEFLLACSDVTDLEFVDNGATDMAGVYAYFAQHGALAELIHATADGMEDYESAAFVLAHSDLDPAHAGLTDLRAVFATVREDLDDTRWTPALRDWLQRVPPPSMSAPTDD